MDKKALKNPFLLAALSGILCILSFPPYNLSFLIWVALAPLLYAIIITPFEHKKIFGILYDEAPVTGFVFGIVFYFGTLHWVYHIFGWFGLFLLLVLCVYPYFFAYCLSYVYNKLKSRWVILLSPAIIWTAIEFVKSEFWILKFSWMNIGYSQHNFLPALQFSSILGQYGITALIIFINSFIVYLFVNNDSTKEKIAVGASVLVIILAIISSGIYYMNENYSPEVKVALVQDESSEFRAYRSLINTLNTDVDFILLPEYALPTYLNEDELLLKEIQNITIKYSAYMIVGSKDKNDDGKLGYYNSAYLINPSGEISGRYYKMNPIQFFNDGDPGKEYSVFQTEHGNIGIFICYDADYSYVARNIVKNGAEMLFIPTYDAMDWSKTQHLQHSAMTSMRAVENGRFIARTTTSGISQIIDPKGRITQNIGLGKTGTAIGNVMPIKKHTFYVDYGFIFPYFAIICTLIILFISFSRKAKPG
ncbi:hypothetical protein JXB28_03310 [Candidatus Woesearchaeota archaeon]|nr:hypothetical protein [Candidatus Woesearchaeota archaeon]